MKNVLYCVFFKHLKIKVYIYIHMHYVIYKIITTKMIIPVLPLQGQEYIFVHEYMIMTPTYVLLFQQQNIICITLFNIN